MPAAVVATAVLSSAPTTSLSQSYIFGGAPPPPIAPAGGPTVGPGDVGSQSVGSGTVTVVGGTNINGSFAAGGTGTGILDTTGGPINVTAGLVVSPGGTISSIGPGPLTVSSVEGDAAASLGGVLSLQNLVLNVTGSGGSSLAGAGAVQGGSVEVTNGTIFANGAGSVGVAAFEGGAVTLTNVSISTSGTGVGLVPAAGIFVAGGGTVVGNGVTVTTTDPGNSALLMQPFSVSPADSASFTDSTLSSSKAPAISVLGGTHDVALNRTSVLGGAQWLDVRSGTDFETGMVAAGNISVTASGSTLAGAASTEAGSTSNVTIQNGTLWTMTGSSNLTNLINTASTINFTPPVGDPTQLASYKTLTVTNYVGANGTIGLNTFLGSDGSPADRLVISGGTASGLTFLNIANTVGPGALTTGSGILVVDAINGATTGDAFRLTGPAVAGPFEYTLFKGNGNPEAWYLRSTLPEPGPSPCPPPGEGPSPPAPTPPGETPNFRPEVSLNAALPNLSLIYGRTILGTLHDRVGDEGSLAAPASSANSAWGRVVAQAGDRNGGCPVLVGPSFDYALAAVQAGFDAIRLQHTSGARDRAGVYGALGGASADVQSQTGAEAGRDRFAAYSVGAYWTHYGALGWYLDGVVQGTFYDVRDESTRLPALTTDGRGLAASVEGGYLFKGALGWSVEPQAQLVYQTIDLADSSDIAARVRFDNVDSLAGRLGVRFTSTWSTLGMWGLGPAQGTVWLRPSYWHEFSDDPRTLFSSALGFVPFRANIAKDWVEVNAGATMQIDRNTALFASGSYNLDTDGNGNAWDGRIGLKVAW